MKNKVITLLKKSERYAKTDMVYLVGQSSWLLIGQGIVFISSFLLAWIFGNFVDPSDYGLYKFVLSIATLATITTLTGLSTALARAYAQGHDVSLIKLLKLRIYWGSIGTLILFIVAGYYLTKDNTLLASLFAITALWIPFYETLSDYQQLLQGKKDFRTQTIARTLQRIVLTLSVVCTIFLTKNIILITLVFFASSTLSQYLALRYTLNKYPLKDDFAVPYKSIINYGKRLSIQNIFFIGASQLDKILMFKFLGPTQLATYFFAVAIPQELSGLLANVNSVAFPKLVDKASPEFKKALLKKIALFNTILLVPIGLYIYIAPYLFAWFFPVYLDAVFISQLFVGTILFIPTSLIWHYFYATDNKPALWCGTFVGPSVLIIGILVFVPLFGLVGAVIANYLRGFVDLFSGLYFFLKKDNSTSPT